MPIDIEQTFTFLLLDNNGVALNSQDVYLNFNYVGDTPTQFPQQVYPLKLADK